MLNKLLGRKATHTVHEKINKELLPEHIAIIMDGNGRWAKSKGLPRLAGHKAGTETFKKITRYCSDIGIKYLTVYAFSTENWNRPKDEVDGLMDIMVKALRAEINELNENNVKMLLLGDVTQLSAVTRSEIEKALKLTADNTGLTLNIALNYGARKEWVEATKTIVQRVLDNQLSIEQINDKVIETCLYTAGMPEPDLLIRTSGEKRISNFLLWQLAYSELWFTDTLWPDFSPEELDQAILDYQNRNRRYGKL